MVEGWKEKIRVKWSVCENHFRKRRLSDPSELHPNLYFYRWLFGYKGYVRLRKKDPMSGKVIFLVVKPNCKNIPVREGFKSLNLTLKTEYGADI